MAKKSSFQIRAEYVLVRVVAGVLGIMPRRLSVRVGQLIVNFLFLFLSDLRRTAFINTGIAFPEKSDDERWSLVRGCFDNLGRVIGEVCHFPTATPEGISQLVEFDFDGLGSEREYYDAQVAKGRGTILAGPHMGNWEIGIFAYSASRMPINYLARRMDNPLIENYITGIRTRFGNRSINKQNSFNETIGLLRNGEVLGVMPDINVQKKDGVFVPFFGIPACTTAGVATLARRTNAMIITMCCVWDKDKRKYVVHHGSLIETPFTDDRHRDEEEREAGGEEREPHAPPLPQVRGNVLVAQRLLQEHLAVQDVGVVHPVEARAHQRECAHQDRADDHQQSAGDESQRPHRRPVGFAQDGSQHRRRAHDGSVERDHCNGIPPESRSAASAHRTSIGGRASAGPLRPRA